MRVKIVGYCPVCDSPRTGYFIGGIPKTETIVNKFQKGERVKFYSLMDNKKNNCYCSACGNAWYQKLKKTYLPFDEFNLYLHEFEFYEERNELRKIKEQRSKKRTLTPEEKSERYNRNTTILAYTTGIDLRKFNPYDRKH